MPFATEDPRVGRARWKKSHGPKFYEPWHIQYGPSEAGPAVVGVAQDHKVKEASRKKTEKELRKLRNANYEKGICSKCRNPLLRTQSGRTFHDIGAIPYGEECEAGVRVPVTEKAEGWDFLAEWERELLGQKNVLPYSESEVDVAHYYFFSLEDING